jgi:hypothetical protein
MVEGVIDFIVGGGQVEVGIRGRGRGRGRRRGRRKVTHTFKIFQRNEGRGYPSMHTEELSIHQRSNG